MEKKSKHLVGSILCGLLTAFCVVAEIISLVDGNEVLWKVVDCVLLVLLFFILFYAFVGYKKPHGNLLKYITLIYAVLDLSAIPAHFTCNRNRIAMLYCRQIG